MKIEIKHRYTGVVLFAHDVVQNTIAITLTAAIASGANLRGSNLRGSNLRGSNLRGILNGSVVLAQTQITPQEGAFVGWKKLQGDVIVRLVIPHDAKRFNSYGSRKCRASKVVVHEMWKSGEIFTGIAYDKHTGRTAYQTGMEIVPDSFDEDKRVECSHGIHFFITREEAEAY